MTDDLDLALRDRLGRLAAATPVRPAPARSPVPVIRARPRALALGSLAPAVAVVVMATLFASLAHVGPFAAGSAEPSDSAEPNGSAVADLGIYVANLDPAAVEIYIDDQFVGSFECGATAEILSAWRMGPPPWDVAIRAPDTGETIDAFSLQGPLPQGVVIRNGDVVHGPWPMSFGPTPDPSCPPPPAIREVSTVTSGDFEFTVKASKGAFSTTEKIDVVGMLTYNGLKNHITIRRAVYGPIGFGLPGAPRDIETEHFSATFACIDMTLERGVPFEVPLQNVHSGLPADFTLPAGRWEVRAAAGFNLDPDCHDEGVSLYTTLVFDVADDAPRASPDSSGELDVERDDNFELRLQSDRSAYFADDPIDASASLAYIAGASGSYSGALTYGATQLDGLNRLGQIWVLPLSCLFRRTSDPPLEAQFSNGLEAEGPQADWANAFGDQPLLHLPAGRWRLTASFNGEVPACDPEGQATALRAWIDITVVDRS